MGEADEPAVTATSSIAGRRVTGAGAAEVQDKGDSMCSGSAMRLLKTGAADVTGKDSSGVCCRGPVVKGQRGLLEQEHAYAWRTVALALR